jgi:hypothetical protein
MRLFLFSPLPTSKTVRRLPVCSAQDAQDFSDPFSDQTRMYVNMRFEKNMRSEKMVKNPFLNFRVEHLSV